jgi:hypothetical protein
MNNTCGEDPHLLGCDSVLLGERFPMFQRNMVPSLHNSRSSPLKTATLSSFKMSGNNHPTTQHHMPDNLISQQCQCKNHSISHDHCFPPPPQMSKIKCHVHFILLSLINKEPNTHSLNDNVHEFDYGDRAHVSTSSVHIILCVNRARQYSKSLLSSTSYKSLMF